MFQLPTFTEVQDNTGSLLMKAAEQARAQQQQMSDLIQKNEQTRLEAFGGLQKQIMDISSAKSLPVEVRRQILKDGMDKLASLYRDRKNVRATEMGVLASETLINAKTTADAYQAYVEGGEKLAASLKDNAIDDVSLRAAIAGSMFDEKEVMTPMGPSVVRIPKDPAQLGDPAQFINKQLELDPSKFLDRAKSDGLMQKATSGYKPSELKIATSKDPTGNLTTKVAYTEKKYPWTRVEDVSIGGQIGKQNVLDTQLEDVPQLNAKIPVLSQRAFEFFSNNPDPAIRAEVVAKGRDYIDAHNRRLGVNPKQITPENFARIAQELPGVINPFDAGNREIFSRVAMTEYLNPQFGKFGEVTVTEDRARDRKTGGSSGDDGYDPILYDKRGNLRPEARWPAAVAQMIGQDAEVMRVADEATITYDGKTITGKRVGDRAAGQMVRDDGKRFTVIARPQEPGVIYVVEIEDNELTDNVTRLSGQEAIDFGARVASANGSDIKSFNRILPSAQKTTVPMTQAQAVSASQDVDLAAQREEGRLLTSNLSLLRSIAKGEDRPIDNARVKLGPDKKEVVVTSISRADNIFFDSPVTVTLKDGNTIDYKNMDEFIKDLSSSNK